jgi:hypothetical protein
MFNYVVPSIHLLHELLFFSVAMDTAVRSQVVDNNHIALRDAVLFSDTQVR